MTRYGLCLGRENGWGYLGRSGEGKVPDGIEKGKSEGGLTSCLELTWRLVVERRLEKIYADTG